MLVLSRKKNETILIEGGITVTVMEIRGDKVRIGIDAPRDINIVRSELVAEQPVNGSSQDGDRMDCEGHDAPFYSETPILNAMV